MSRPRISIDSVVLWGIAGLFMLVSFLFFGNIVMHGWQQFSPDFLFSNPEDSGRSGGIFPILVSTTVILGVCVIAVIPVAIATAVWIVEFNALDSLAARFVSRSLDVLASMPSIVIGMFGNAFFSVFLGFGFSILSGGLTLACMVLPIVTRTTEDALRSVPEEQRLAGYALGMPRTAVLTRVLLPASAPGIVAGLVLGIGRATAETAALIFTSGYVMRLPSSVFDSGRSLSVHILDLAMNVPGGDANAYASAFTLLILLLGINITIQYIGRPWMVRNAA